MVGCSVNENPPFPTQFSLSWCDFRDTNQSLYWSKDKMKLLYNLASISLEPTPWWRVHITAHLLCSSRYWELMNPRNNCTQLIKSIKLNDLACDLDCLLLWTQPGSFLYLQATTLSFCLEAEFLLIFALESNHGKDTVLVNTSQSPSFSSLTLLLLQQSLNAYYVHNSAFTGMFFIFQMK